MEANKSLSTEVPSEEKGASQNEQVVPAAEKKLTRRDFINKSVTRLFLGGLSAAALFSRVKSELMRGLRNGLSNDIVSSLVKISELDRSKENEQFRDMSDLVAEAITNYQTTSKQQAFYERDESYRDVDYYADTIEKITEGLSFTHPKDIIEEVKAAFPPDAFEAFMTSEVIFSDFTQIYSKGSGFLARLVEAYPDAVGDDGILRRSTVVYETVRQMAKAEMTECKQFIEEQTEQGRSPVSSSKVLEHFMHINKGNIAQAIYDTTMFLKVMARGNFETGIKQIDERNISWYQENIEDEFKGPSYVDPEQSEQALNLIGKPYHSWNLVMMLEFFPVELIQAGGVYRQTKNFRAQGLSKMRADLQTLADMKKIESELLKHL